VTVEVRATRIRKCSRTRCARKPDEPFRLSTLESDLARLYGRGEFEQIDYQLTTVGNQNGVIVTVTEKSWGPNFLRFGTSLSTDFQARPSST
jgi:NTE family protein